MTLLAVGLTVALGALVFGALGVTSRLRVLEQVVPMEVTPPFDAAPIWESLSSKQTAILRLENQVDDQTLAIAEGIERVGRAEKRIAETVRRAKRRADEAGYEDPGVEAEVAELHRRDGDGSEQLQIVQPDVEDDVGDASSVRGVSVEQLQRARGLR